MHKETLKARYTAAQAATSAGQVLGGMSEEMGDVDLATRRAEDTTARLQARADALDELRGSRPTRCVVSGSLPEVTIVPGVVPQLGEGWLAEGAARGRVSHGFR